MLNFKHKVRFVYIYVSLVTNMVSATLVEVFLKLRCGRNSCCGGAASSGVFGDCSDAAAKPPVDSRGRSGAAAQSAPALGLQEHRRAGDAAGAGRAASLRPGFGVQ